MRTLSGLIRLVTGLAIMGMATYIYLMNQQALEGTDPVTLAIAGQEITATPQRIIIGLVFAAAVGGMIELLGILTLVTKPKAKVPPSA